MRSFSMESLDIASTVRSDMLTGRWGSRRSRSRSLSRSRSRSLSLSLSRSRSDSFLRWRLVDEVSECVSLELRADFEERWGRSRSGLRSDLERRALSRRRSSSTLTSASCSLDGISNHHRGKLRCVGLSRGADGWMDSWWLVSAEAAAVLSRGSFFGIGFLCDVCCLFSFFFSLCVQVGKENEASQDRTKGG